MLINRQHRTRLGTVALELLPGPALPRTSTPQGGQG